MSRNTCSTLIAARGARTQAVMAELLGLLTNTYGKYEGVLDAV